MCSLVILYVLNNWSGIYPKGYVIFLGYIHLAGLPCLVPVEKEVIALQSLEVPGRQKASVPPSTHRPRRVRKEGMIVRRDDRWGAAVSRI